MRLVHFGTFDVENFGDLLYPLIVRHRLAALEADITFASPVGGPAVWQDGVATVPVSGVEEGSLDGALLGGGNIVHAGPAGVAAYRRQGLTSLLAYTRLWLAPAELARGRGLPALCWNAPGIPQAMTPRAAEVLRWAASAASYLSVRDAHSLRNLQHAGIDAPAAVVPDTALDGASLWSPDELAEARAALALPERTLAVHLNDRYVDEPPDQLAQRLDRIARRTGATVVLLALGPCHGDDVLARRVGRAMRSNPVIVDRPRSLRQIAGAIAGAQAYVGSSLHGAVTAAAFGRPAVVVAREADHSGKFSGFLEQFQLGAWRVDAWADAEEQIDPLLAASDEFARVPEAAAPLLDRHWDSIVSTLRESASRRSSSPRTKAPPSLDGIIDEGIEAILAPSQRLTSRVAELEESLATAARELEDVQRRIAERDAIVSRLSDAIEQAREERDRADRAVDSSEVEQAREEARRAAAEREARAAEGEQLREQLRSETTRAGAAEQEVRAAQERMEAVTKEAEELAAQLSDESEQRRAVAALHEESLGRERALRDRLVRERDEMEERLEATLSALNEARRPAPPDPELQTILTDRDRLRAQLLAEQAAREGLEEHVAALRDEIELHAGGTVPPSASPVEPASAPPPPPVPVALTSAPVAPRPGDPESAAAAEFSERYAELCDECGLADLDARERAEPWPVFPPPPSGAWAPRASIIVCVHNALDDVRRCLASVASHLTVDAEVVVVDDGSDEPTARFLRAAAERNARVRLISNAEPPHGYTIAANLGLGAATGEYLVLLNSDTIVTSGWLERVIECGEADERIGIIGPVSNAASHQSVPKVRDRGSWATNPLPGWLTVDGMGVAVAGTSSRERPRVPFVNGYCYAIKRRTLDAVGYLDEEHFADGYCEENDFSLRAREAGFSGAVADDAFVFHAKSRSYTPEGRDMHAKRNYARFVEKHGEETVQPLVDQLEEFPPVFELGKRLERVLADPARLVQAVHERLGRAVEPVFVLPGVAHGGSGGSHSIVQEAAGLRALGVPARIAIGAKVLDRAHSVYPEHADVFVPFSGEGDLHDLAADANVLIATHSDSVPAVSRAVADAPHVVPAYYVQDYEPFFWPEGSDYSLRSAASYTALPNGVLFAKTHWLCNLVASAHGVTVHKVEPSIDSALYRAPDIDRDPSGRVVIAAMVRLRTPRRQPRSTVRLLERLAHEFGGRVEIVTFGCKQEELDRVTDYPGVRDGHRGLLSRAEVASVLQRADVFVDLSVYQAFGRTALEAMACGCVPVVPVIGGAWEFAQRDANALVCDTHDVGAVHAAVTAAIADADRRGSYAAAALATASGYSIERAALSEFALFAGALLARDRTDRPEQIASRAG